MRFDIDLHDPHRLDALTEAELDALPFGAIRVDAEGRILFYSRGEADITGRSPAAVLGRNFFTELAPCTVVPEFYGRFRRGLLTGQLHTTFDFVLDFDMQPLEVRITMRDSQRPGEFWILVEPKRTLRAQNDAHNDARAAALLAQQAGDRSAGGAALAGASFDFSRCDEEPIASPGVVQPFGCLLVLAPDGQRVLAASANTEMYLGLAPAEVLGRPVAELFPRGDGGLTQGLRCLAAGGPDCPTFFHTPAPDDDLRLHLRLTPWRQRLLLEIEHAAPDDGVAGVGTDADRLLEGFDFGALLWRLNRSEDAPAVCGEAVRALRRLTGFERVLAYRLEPDGDGVVVAESLADGAWSPVLGLRYPASDIPRQARALYADMPIRYAPSRDHAAVPLLGQGVAPETLDIGGAQLRAQSPIHRAYLASFGVNGSLSLSIVADGRLWGLLIFHHRRPHPVSPALRRRLVELAAYLSTRLALIEQQREQHDREIGVAAVSRMIRDIDLKRPFPLCFEDKAEMLCRLVDADGVQLYHRGEPLFRGGSLGLEEADAQALFGFLRGCEGPIWSTDCLSAVFEPASAYPERLAGVLAVFVGGDGDRSILLFGRRRTRCQVRWGADPASLPLGPDEEELRHGWPNRKFQPWNEERTHHARPWTTVELATAGAVRELTHRVILTSAAHFEALALHDTLTGLPNRTRFRNALAEVVERCAEDGQIFGVGILDIDHFKTINDSLGHDKGDLLLLGAAQRLRHVLPADAEVARLGGDEFALLFPPGHEDALDAMPERVIEALRAPILIGEERFAVTGSMGVTLGHGLSDISELLKQADLALYKAKEAGRNRVCGFDTHLHQQVLSRHATTREVLGGDPERCVELWLQPQLAVAAPVQERRFEVLSRWRAADGRLLMPADYIAAAERNGMIREVTTAVLRKAVALLQERLQAGDDGLKLAVNVSASDLDEAEFVRTLLALLHDADVPPDMIELEITESMLLRMTPGLKRALSQLADGGVALSLDDFGSGFSSLAYLRELPIATLKIDQIFIDGVTDPRDQRLVAGMIAMAHSLGKAVVAEGIETPAQLEVLRQLGCDFGQGYLWAHPQPPAQALQLDFAALRHP